MFIVQLKFSENKSQAKQYMQSHLDWLQAGYDKGVFVLSGSIQPNLGGGIIANGVSLEELEGMVAEDPFVEHKIVTSEIIELSASKCDDRLSFLLN